MNPAQVSDLTERRNNALTGVSNLVLRALPAIPAAPRFCSSRLEGDDAALNGMTRSLQRRLFGLNVPTIPKAA